MFLKFVFVYLQLTNSKSMFAKYINIMNGKTFIVNENGKKYLDDNSSMKFVGNCTEEGAMIQENNTKPEAYLDDETKLKLKEEAAKVASKSTTKKPSKKAEKEELISEEDDEA